MRSIGLRRKAYVANHSGEEFIVPLIKNSIDKLIEEYKEKIVGKKVIDIGSGSQPFRAALENAGGTYSSMDIEQHFETQTDFSGGIDQELCGAVLDAGPFSFILCTEVLEHVADWDKAFQNFHTLLAPNGILIITTPFFYPLHEVPYDYWRPTPFAFQYFSKKHNLLVDKYEQSGGFLDVLGTLYGNHAYVKPRKSTLFRRFQNKVIHLYIKYSLKILKSRYLHKNFEIKNPFYQTTVCVITKQS